MILKRNRNKPSAADHERAYAPHCDSAVLHAPGACQYCDDYPDWQKLRIVQRINFSDEWDADKSPCPSTWFRSEEIRNRWGGNRPKPEGTEPGWV